jgi:hypothetical protein
MWILQNFNGTEELSTESHEGTHDEYCLLPRSTLYNARNSPSIRMRLQEMLDDLQASHIDKVCFHARTMTCSAGKRESISTKYRYESQP